MATTTSTANVDLVKSLGADVVVDYKKEDFEKVLNGYDVVLNSLGKDTLEKSLKVLKPGGKLISISGPPDAAFAKESGFELVLPASHAPFELRHPEKGQAARRQLLVCFHASERRAVEQDHVAHRIWDHPAGHGSGLPVRSDQEALTYLETGRAKGKVVIRVK